MYSGSLADSVQLAISINCLSLLVIITGIYFIYFYQTRERAFFAGAVITLDVMLFVLAETVIIISGWHNNLSLGRQLHRAEQAGILLFLTTLPYFLKHAFPPGKKIRRVLDAAFWLGLAGTVFIMTAAYVFPDSLIAVDKPSATPALSPGDFTRGLEGPLFMARDIALAAFIILALIYSIIYITRKNRTFQSLCLFLGLLIAIIGGIDDIQYVYSGHNLYLDNLRFSRFTLGATIMLLFFLAAVFSKFFRAHTMLEKMEQDLEISEHKYTMLMDAADEILFSLDRDFKIISANQKATNMFHLSEDEPLAFEDCLYLNELDDDKDNLYFTGQLQQLRNKGDMLSFNTYIKDWVTFEPVEYHFRFDCFTDAGSFELIGRAWPTASSKLLEFVETERLSLNVDNYITMVGDIVDRLTSNVKRFLDEGDVMMLKMGLNEMVVNAMEHGNLNVTFDEKTRAQEEGRLFDFMSERRQLPEYSGKKVMIDYHLDSEKVIYRITDMGPGFDYKKIMDRVKNEVNQQELTHGRGIIMTQAVFDKVEYNKKGNQVLLMKNFNRER